MDDGDLRHIGQRFELLQQYIERENFRGYDPYDTLNSEFPFARFGRTFSILALQFQKRNPVNIRPVLAIHKETNNMGLGLLLRAYCELQEGFVHRSYQSQAALLFKLLKESVSKNSVHSCWGYNFDWPTKNKFIVKDTPNVVVSAFAASGIYEYYRLTKREEAAGLILSVAEFVLKELKVTEDESGICFSYTPIEADCCYNASLFGALILSQAYSISRDEGLMDRIARAVNFVVSRQHADGRWNYSIDIKTGKERTQVDFHQGFILETLHEIQELTGKKFTGVDEALRKGAEFYYKAQFLTNGRSLWRLPKQFPIDIHNQSQGILTFTKLAHLNKDYSEFAKTIAVWTIKNMQSDNGFFYYRNYPLYKIRISYMRWSQATMFYALSRLLIHFNRSHA